MLPNIDPATYVPPAGSILILRTCAADMTSHGGFLWPTFGPVEAPDWKPVDDCGNGLHGFARGVGDGGLASFDDSTKWVVAEVVEADMVDISGKVKFPRAIVLYAGDRKTATEFIQRIYPGEAVVGGTATAGDSGTATAGDSGTATAGDSGTATAGYSGTATAGDSGTATAGGRGTATAGDSGTATAGYSGTATAGDRGTATAGDSGTATAGYSGTATAGDSGTATAGDSGTATAGDRGTATAGGRGTATAGDRGTATAGGRGTATAGDRGTATAGYSGTATAGDRGTATAGDSGTATAGDRGCLVIRRWDGVRYRLVIGYVGEAGILPGVPYRLDESGVMTQAKK